MRAIIIDDEPNAVELLELRLAQQCPQVEVVATSTNSVKGVALIKELRPDVVFLDIEMPQMNGFQVLEAVEDIPFSLVFVTAYDKFALKAFRYSALDYLLKPIDTKELVQAIYKIEKQQQTSKEQVSHLKSQFTSVSKVFPDKIALPYQNGVAFVALSDILYCESDDSYTKFHLPNAQIYLVTKPLKEIQDLLEDRGFLRIHRQYLINLNHIKKFVKGEGSYVIMADGQSISCVAFAQRKTDRIFWVALNKRLILKESSRGFVGIFNQTDDWEAGSFRFFRKIAAQSQKTIGFAVPKKLPASNHRTNARQSIPGGFEITNSFYKFYFARP